ncbi:hypothetical protein DBR23_02770 [Acidovorax sp. HMWF018]|nr:hypothetical protein DBR23_02770 [Acidovorax sp. HMWF018]
MIESRYEPVRFGPTLQITKLPVDDALNSRCIDQILGTTGVNTQGPHDVVEKKYPIRMEIRGKVIFRGWAIWNERQRTLWSVLGHSQINEPKSVLGCNRPKTRDFNMCFGSNNICT